MSRRTFAAMAGAALLARSGESRTEPRSGNIVLVLAPSNLGLRPAENGAQQGAWRAPQALMDAGLEKALSPQSVVALERPTYEYEAQPGTRIRNGNTIRAFAIELAGKVLKGLNYGFPVVIGGDCSVLLGCLLASRAFNGRGLVHVDGHSDFFHPGNYDTAARLGSAAGMDLALASGRGEKLLTEWPEAPKPLADDEDILQMGERDAGDPNFRKFYGDILDTRITQWTVQRILKNGVEVAAREALARMESRSLARVWLHVDLDVLDESVMPAVDSPGKPGLNFEQLSTLVRTLCASGRIVGADFCIYDPERDPDKRYAKPLVDCIARGILG